VFDIGFAELLLIAVVALLVIGPERLPGAIKTASVWLGRLKRSYNDIKREVELELHNNEVMENLKRAQSEIHDAIDTEVNVSAQSDPKRPQQLSEPNQTAQRNTQAEP
jgi:sec-independent protein translocase protein TatB